MTDIIARILPGGDCDFSADFESTDTVKTILIDPALVRSEAFPKINRGFLVIPDWTNSVTLAAAFSVETDENTFTLDSQHGALAKNGTRELTSLTAPVGRRIILTLTLSGAPGSSGVVYGYLISDSNAGTGGGGSGDASIVTYENLDANSDVGTTASTVAAGDDARFTDARTPLSHGNEAHDVTFIVAAGVTYEALNANADVGTVASTVAAGDDARFTDARTPLSHGNEAHDVTFITSTGVTYEALNANADVGTAASTVAAGDDARFTDARTPLSHGNEAHDVSFIVAAGVTYEALNANADVGTVASTVAAGDDARFTDARTPTEHGNEAHGPDFIEVSEVTYESLDSNDDIGTGGGRVAAGDDARFTDARTPLSHGNEAHDVTFITSTGVTYEALNTNGDIGTTASTVAAGDDARFTDARTPLSHGNEAHDVSFYSAGDIIETDSVISFNAVPLSLLGKEANGASAVGVTTGSSLTYSSTGSKIHSFVNNATEVAFIDKDGDCVLDGYVDATSFYISGTKVVWTPNTNTIAGGKLSCLGVTPDYSSYWGGNSGRGATGSSMAGVGYNSFLNSTATTGGSGIGTEAGYGCAGAYPTCLGYASGTNQTGNYFLGTGVWAGRFNEGNSVFCCGPFSGQGNLLDNALFVDISDTQIPLIGGDFSTDQLRIGGDAVIIDPADTGSEVLSETDFATHANWDTTGDFDDTGGNAVYTHSAGSGTLTQTSGNFATAATGNRWYKLAYSISSPSGDPAAEITSAFADVTTKIRVKQVGTRNALIYTKSTPGDFAISVTSTSGGFTLDDITLREISGGDLWARGDAEILGTSTLNPIVLGSGGPRLKNSSGVIEARNNADDDYAIARGANPVGDNDLVTKSFMSSAGGGSSYVYGLECGTPDDATGAYTVEIYPGTCWDDTGATFLNNTGTISVDLDAGTGVNKLDTGVAAINTQYYLFLIWNPTSETLSGLFSASKTSPTMPAGYTLKKLVSYAKNDGSGDLFEFYVTGKNNTKTLKYIESHNIMRLVSSGSSTSFVDVDCTPFIPAGANGLFLLQQATSGKLGYLRIKATRAPATIGMIMARQVDNVIEYLRTDSNGKVQYRSQASGNVYVDALGFQYDI